MTENTNHSHTNGDTINITVLYFAWIRTKLQTTRDVITLNDTLDNTNDGATGNAITVASLVKVLQQKGDAYNVLFSDISGIKIAVNQEFSNIDMVLKNNDEVAFFPPVTGG